MKRIRLTALLSVLLLVALAPYVGTQSFHTSEAFLDTAEDVNSTITATNGTDFDSVEIVVSLLGHPSQATIIITFTGDGSMDGLDVDFFFQLGYLADPLDPDTITWSTTSFLEIDCASDTDHATNVVRHPELVQFPGAYALRLWKIVNNDASSNVTACNATICW